MITLSETSLEKVSKQGFLFIRIPRTASTSILSVVGGQHRHITAKRYKEMLDSAFDGLWKFSVCRNPYTRFVSAYHSQPSKHVKQNINEILEHKGVKDLIKTDPQHYMLQTDYLYDDKLMVDYLGRFEELDKTWKHIMKELKINEPLPHIGASQKVELTDKAKKPIYEYYKKDFDLLCYSS